MAKRQPAMTLAQDLKQGMAPAVPGLMRGNGQPMPQAYLDRYQELALRGPDALQAWLANRSPETRQALMGHFGAQPPMGPAVQPPMLPAVDPLRSASPPGLPPAPPGMGGTMPTPGTGGPAPPTQRPMMVQQPPMAGSGMQPPSFSNPGDLMRLRDGLATNQMRRGRKPMR